MANRQCICPRCGRRNKFKGVCRRCVEALDRMVEQHVPESWKPFVVKPGRAA